MSFLKGGLKAIVQAMKDYQGRKRLQASALSLIRLLCSFYECPSGGGGNTEEDDDPRDYGHKFSESLVKLGGWYLICAALSRFPISLDVQSQGAGCLGILCWRGVMNKNATTLFPFLTENTIRSFTSKLQQREHGNGDDNPIHYHLLVFFKGIRMLHKAGKAHWPAGEVAKVLVAGFQSNEHDIVSLVTAQVVDGLGPQCCHEIVLQGGQRPLVIALQKWTNDRMVWNQVFLALCRLSDRFGLVSLEQAGHTSTSRFILHTQTMQLTVQAMRKRQDDEWLQRHGMTTIIGNLCGGHHPNEEVVELLKKHFVEVLGGISLICDTMKVFPNAVEIQRQAIWLLGITLVDQEVIVKEQSSIIRDDVLPVFATAMEKFPLDECLHQDATNLDAIRDIVNH